MNNFFTIIFSIFTSPYWIGTWLSTATLYIISSCGASFCIKSGNFNLGGEAQIYLGGFITTLILTKMNLPTFLGLLIAFFLSAILCGTITLFSAFLKQYKNASFLLTSFIISSAIIPLLDGLISGPLRTTGNVISMPTIPQKYCFSSILSPSPLNISIFISIIISFIVGYIFYKTNFGKQLQIYGIAQEFAVYSGFNHNRLIAISSFFSGALHGITGTFAVCGIYFTCYTDFYIGLGWSALSVAMIAKANPFLIIPSSLFMSFLIVAANKVSIYSNMNFDISSLIQGLVIFCVSIPFFSNISIKTNKITKKG